MRARLRDFWRDERAATAIEYGMIGVLISISIVAGVTAIGTRLSSKFLGPLAGGLS